MSDPPTYYEILELSPAASPSDVRRAYRRLALLHHPDRNNGSAESTERFKLVNEAYEVLSDDGRRREYDGELRGAAAAASKSAARAGSRPYGYDGLAAGIRHRARVDPFARFDDLFRNDPYFRDAFRDMDDEFARRFARGGGGGSRSAAAAGSGGGANAGSAANGSAGARGRRGWGAWLLDCLGVDFHMTSYTSTSDGGYAASSYSSRGGLRGTYTDKKTREFVENGRRVTVRSMEQDGNRIEDRYVDGTLAERRVNGILEPVRRIGDG